MKKSTNQIIKDKINLRLISTIIKSKIVELNYKLLSVKFERKLPVVVKGINDMFLSIASKQGLRVRSVCIPARFYEKKAIESILLSNAISNGIKVSSVIVPNNFSGKNKTPEQIIYWINRIRKSNILNIKK